MAKAEKTTQKPKPRKNGRARALALPDGLPSAAAAPEPKALRRAAARQLAPYEISAADAQADILDQLWAVVESRRVGGDTEGSHSARLLARGSGKVAQKLGEEAVECVIEAALGNRDATVLESADLLYHLVVVWVDAGIKPGEVWAELARRQGISGIAEKASRPKGFFRAARTTKLP